MRIEILILTIEEETAATLRVKVPKQNAQPAFGKETSKVNGCCGFTNATFDVIYGDLFQKILVTFSEVETKHKMIREINIHSLIVHIA